MVVNRDQWAERVSAIPNWLCPTCQRGHLKANAKIKMVIVETGESSRGRDYDDWEPDWMVNRFVTMIQCDDNACGEVVAVSGTLKYVEGDFDSGNQHYVNQYEIEATVPAPLPILIHKKVPPAVALLLAAAAPHLWSDPEAAANKIRQSVEAFLTDQGVVRFTTGRNGKRATL